MHMYINVAQVWGLSLVTIVLGVMAYEVIAEAKDSKTDPWRVLKLKFDKVFK